MRHPVAPTLSRCKGHFNGTVQPKPQPGGMHSLLPTATERSPTKGLSAAVLFGLAITTCLLTIACLAFTREVGRVAAVWPINAFIVVALLRAPRKNWTAIVLVGIAGIVAGNLLSGDPWLDALLLSSCNIIEVVLCAALIGGRAGPSGVFNERRNLLAFLCVAGVVAPLSSGVFAAGFLATAHGTPFVESLLRWYSADALGLLTVTPALLVLTSGTTARLGLKLRGARGWLSIGVLIACVAAVFSQESYPLLFLIPPALILVAFELELAGAALALLVTSLVAIVATLTGHGPASLIQGGIAERLVILQLFLATLTVSVLPVAVALMRQRRLQAELSEALAAAKETERRVRELHRRSVLSEQIAGVGHWRLDLGSNTRTWSDITYAIHGLQRDTPAEVLDRAVDLYVPADRERIRETLELAVSGGQPFALEVRLNPADGSAERLVVLKGEVERDAKDQVQAVFGVMWDVTEQRAASAALAESEARYRLLTDNATDVIACYSPDGVFTFLSPSLTSITGYEPAEMVGKLTTHFILPADVKPTLRRFRNYVAGGAREPMRFEYRAVRKDGAVVWLEAQVKAVFDASGDTIVEFQDVVRDITRRKATEAALEKSELRYRVIAENATDIVSRTGVDGVVLELSPSIEAVSGYSIDEVVGQDWTAFLHPDDVESTLRVYRDVIVGTRSGTEPIGYRVRHKDGRWLWLEGNPTPVRDADGRIIEFIDVTRDVSSRMQLQADLRTARDAAEAAAAAKSDFMANISHEIRTPLTAILGFTGLLKADSSLNDSARSKIARVSTAGQALLTLVNDVLDFSKLEAGLFDILPVPTLAHEAFSDTLGMFGPQAEARGLVLVLELAEELPPCLSLDSHRLQQVLNNLISNAIKFTNAGQVTLRADYDANKGRLRVAVRDSGTGMTKSQTDKLFKRFSQVDASSTRRHGGTGLGLAICKGLVEAMGGEIGVTSVLGEGSVFWFELPAASVASRESDDDQPDTAFLQGVRILVADDNPTNRELARVVLEALGAEVTDAIDGEAALEAGLSWPFDILLLDVRMPGLSGPDVAREIRSRPGPNAGVPVLAFTADNPVEQAGGDGVFDGVVRKPLATFELIAELSRHLAWDDSDQVASSGAAHG